MRNPIYNGINDSIKDEAYKDAVRQERKELNACSGCGDKDFSPNIEAFEISGKLLCDECADEVFEENSQFGVGS